MSKQQKRLEEIYRSLMNLDHFSSILPTGEPYNQEEIDYYIDNNMRNIMYNLRKLLISEGFEVKQ